MFLDKNMQNEVSSYKYGKSAKPRLYPREKTIFIKSSIAKDTPSYLYEDFISYKLHRVTLAIEDCMKIIFSREYKRGFAFLLYLYEETSFCIFLSRNITQLEVFS